MRDLHCKAMPFRPADNSPFRRHYAPMGATRRSLLCLCMCDGFSIAHRRENARIIAEAPPVAEKARRFRGSVPVFTPQGGWKPADTTVFRIAEAPPVAEKARRFRGSVPVFTPQRGRKPADTTVFRIAEAPPAAYFSQQFFLFVSDGILFVNSDKKYAKNAARNRWFLDFLSSQELRSLWAVKGIDSATAPLPLRSGEGACGSMVGSRIPTASAHTPRPHSRTEISFNHPIQRQRE